MSKKFICSDNGINSYGFRVLSSGIDLTGFKKNPVGLFNHCNNDDDPNYNGPICIWPDLALEGDNLVGTPVFDLKDPKAAEIARKVDEGFLNACSIGFQILAISEDPADMLAGQTYPTITKCQLMEISIVDIPSNMNAVCCYDESGKRLELNAGMFEKLKATHTPTNNLNNMKKITLKAGLIALAAFLGISGEDAKNDLEVEFTPEKQAELNAKLLSIETLTSEKTQLSTDLAAKVAELTAKVTELTAKNATIAELNAKVTELGAQPGTVASEANAANAEGANGGTNNEFYSQADAKLAELKASMGLTA
jgi:HK97 family phage prohead protease